MMERIAECMIDQSLKVDDQLRTVMRNDIAEEEGLEWLFNNISWIQTYIFLLLACCCYCFVLCMF